MVKQNKHDELPIASFDSQQPLHQRTTSVPTTLLSANNNASDGSTVAIDPANGHGRVSKSVSHAPNEPITAGFVNRGKDWEFLHCDKPGSVQSSASLFKPLKKTGLFGSAAGSQPKSSQGTSYPRSQLASPLSGSQKDLGPKSAPPLATSVIQTYLDHSPVSLTYGLDVLPSVSLSEQTAETSYQRPQLASLRPLTSKDVGPKSAPSLALSAIRTYLQHSPTFPTLGPNTSSPVSVGDQSSGTTTGRKIAPTCLPSPDHRLLPKYVSAFDYAMRPFLDARADDSHERLLRLPLPTHQVVSSSRRLPLPDAADTVYDSNAEEVIKEEELTECSTPSHLWKEDAFTTTMQHTQLSVYLMHCVTLQSIIDQVHGEPWKSSQNQRAAWYYGKMVELAYKARPLAEALKSDELQARCEYWAGRACGGSRDYSAAEEHFNQAILLDLPNDKYNDGRARRRGLLPKEKADVRFLLDSCRKRARNHERYEKRMTKEVEGIRTMADEDGFSLDAYTDRIQQAMPSSPPWLPGRDRLVALAKAEFEKPSKNAGEKPQHNMGDDAQVYLQTDDEYMQAENRGRLLAKEWAYIKYGDMQEAERRERQRSAESAFTPLQKHSTTSTRSSSTTSNFPSLASLPDLANELAGLGYDDETPEPSPTSEYSVSSQEAPNPIASEEQSLSTYQTLPHETEGLEWQRPSPLLTPTPARSFGSLQALTPTALEQHSFSISQTLPHELTDVLRQYSLRSRTPSLEQNSSLATESSISTDSESDAPFSIDFLLDKNDFDYQPQASPAPHLSLQQRRSGSYLDPINTIPVPPRSNRRPTSRQAKKESPRTPLAQ